MHAERSVEANASERARVGKRSSSDNRRERTHAKVCSVSTSSGSLVEPSTANFAPAARKQLEPWVRRVVEARKARMVPSLVPRRKMTRDREGHGSNERRPRLTACDLRLASRSCEPRTVEGLRPVLVHNGGGRCTRWTTWRDCCGNGLSGKGDFLPMTRSQAQGLAGSGSAKASPASPRVGSDTAAAPPSCQPIDQR